MPPAAPSPADAASPLTLARTPGAALDRASTALLRWAGTALATTALTSALRFGLYILAFYAGALADGDLTRWNGVLPRLYEPTPPAATAGIGLHFAAGGTLLVLGGLQLVGLVRVR